MYDILYYNSSCNKCFKMLHLFRVVTQLSDVSNGVVKRPENAAEVWFIIRRMKISENSHSTNHKVLDETETQTNKC